MDRVRIGIVGLGEVAQTVHLPILEALADRYQITALCDVSPTLLRVLGDRHQVAPEARFADYRDLVAQDDVDAVLVLTADEYHADVVIAACRAGKHVLVEKPMTLTLTECDAVIQARDEAGVQVMVAYMRRFAPAFVAAIEEVRQLDKINYVRVRDIIGRNRLIIDQAHAVLRPDDIPADIAADRAGRARWLVHDAIGEAPPELVRAYRLLCGLSSHDLSAMRELLGFPLGVVAATQWNGGNFMVVVFAYDGYRAILETGVDDQRRFDAHIEVYGPTRSIHIKYDTPYIRHLPTTLIVSETIGESFTERVVRPTFKDPYTHELETFHQVVTAGETPKTTPEDFRDDLRLFRMIVDKLRLDRSEIGIKSS